MYPLKPTQDFYLSPFSFHPWVSLLNTNKRLYTPLCSQKSTILGVAQHLPNLRHELKWSKTGLLVSTLETAVYQLAFMTCLWVPSWQSSTIPVKACHTFTWHDRQILLPVPLLHLYMQSTAHSLPSLLFFSFSLLVCSGQQSTFFLPVTLPVCPLPLPHSPLHLSLLFPHWSKVLFLPPSCF